MNWRWLVLCVGACRPTTVVESAASVPASQSVSTRWVRAHGAADSGLLDAPARVLGAPDSSAAVSPPMLARVIRVRVRPGQQVVVDEPLVDVLMPDLLKAAGSLASAQIKVEAYDKRRSQLESLRQEGLARQAELADVEAQLSTARADGQAARATVRAAGLTDAQATALLSGSGVIALRAPIAGVVTSADVLPGEVRDTTGKPFAVIVGAGEGRVEARLPSASVVGARFVFVGSGAPVPLHLITESPRVEQSDGARLAWFSAPSGGLDVGQSGRVRVLAQPSWQVIPTRAVRKDGQVLVRKGESSVATPVTVLAHSGGDSLVEGLAPGAEVAADAGAPQ